MRKRKGSHGKQSRATRAKIKAGVKLYWKRVKRLKRRAVVPFARARRMYKAGFGRPKSAPKKRGRVKITGILWPLKGEDSPQFVPGPFEENTRHFLDKRIPRIERRYLADVVFRFTSADESEGEYPETLEWTSASPAAFWGEYWIAVKDWLRSIVAELDPRNAGKTEDGSPPAEGSPEIEKIVMGKPE